MRHLSIENYEVFIYGDGIHEYNGFYKVVIDKFIQDTSVMRYTGKNVYYFISDIKTLEKYLKRNINEVLCYRDYHKWRLVEVINAISLR